MADQSVTSEVPDLPGDSHTALRPVGLRRWLWISFLKTAIVPLLFIEIGFLAIFLISNALVHGVNVATMKTTSEAFLKHVSQLEADQVETTLAAIARNTQLLANRTAQALDTPFIPAPAERARYGMSNDGAFYTRYDIGTTASFYSGVKPIGSEQIAKVLRLAALDPLMIELNNTDPLVVSVYINTKDSYNRIYPYFDVLKQYPSKMNIPKYNFYYAADEQHNPKRRPVWTEAYVDPAGHEWMISSVAPVWRKDRLEAVVGQDVTLGRIISRLLSLKLPWGSYAMLVDDQARIIAMPPAAEKALAIRERTDHNYQKAIQHDTIKPRTYDLAAHPQTRDLAAALVRHRDGQVAIPVNGGSIASFHEIDGPGWKLVVIAEQGRIFAAANQMQAKLTMLGWTMAAALVLFYVLFFWFLYLRAQAMADGLARPINRFANMFVRIGAGDYDQPAPCSRIAELDALGREIAATGRSLGAAHNELIAHQKVTEKTLEDLRKRAEEELRFVRVVSHEVRTPLAVIDSGAQILERKAHDAQPAEIIRRMRRFRQGVARIARLVEKLEQSSDSTALSYETNGHADAAELVEALARNMVPNTRLELMVKARPAPVSDAASLLLALRTVFDNAMRYTECDGPIRVEVTMENDRVDVCVHDTGMGLMHSEAAMVGEGFFRGSIAADSQGAGVGLYIARKCLEAVGGTLAFQSGPAGSSATLTMPARCCPATDQSVLLTGAISA